MNADYKEQLTATADGLRELVSPQRSLAQLCVRFVLDQPGVGTVITGSKSFQHMAENARAADLPSLTPEEQARLRDLGFNW
jgi:aryl-alcohol dehydrogenase-like predicted oxidoreductase